MLFPEIYLLYIHTINLFPTVVLSISVQAVLLCAFQLQEEAHCVVNIPVAFSACQESLASTCKAPNLEGKTDGLTPT